MIKQEDVVKIGKLYKPHGIKGEISFSFTNDSFDESECAFLICELDDILVPFILEEYRFRSDTSALIKLKNVNSEPEAKALMHKDVYFPKKYIRETEEESFTWDYFVGFTLVDLLTGTIGVILEVNTTTMNTLFVVEYESNQILIPAVESMIRQIDEKQKILQVELPEGLLSL